jgi:hypothetical protein
MHRADRVTGRSGVGFFDGLAARQMVDCHWQQHGKDVQSLWRKQDKNTYQCDPLAEKLLKVLL